MLIKILMINTRTKKVRQNYLRKTCDQMLLVKVLQVTNICYSINKGKKILYCIRSKTVENKLVDINTMMFVAIHES